MIFELEWHDGLSILPSKTSSPYTLSMSQYAGARPSLIQMTLKNSCLSFYVCLALTYITLKSFVRQGK